MNGEAENLRVGGNLKLLNAMFNDDDDDDDYKDPSPEEVIDWMFSDPDARKEFLEGDGYAGN